MAKWFSLKRFLADTTAKKMYDFLIKIVLTEIFLTNEI